MSSRNERVIMTAGEAQRSLVRVSHEIVERHGGTAGLALVGIERRGPTLARAISAAIEAREGVSVPVSALDASSHRDDRDGTQGPDAAARMAESALRPYDPAMTTVVLVDDVLFTGRTVRAALDALIGHGRPASVRLAVLIDRGHRELPIRADYVGKNVPTALTEHVEVRVSEGDILGDVVLSEGR